MQMCIDTHTRIDTQRTVEPSLSRHIAYASDSTASARNMNRGTSNACVATRVRRGERWRDGERVRQWNQPRRRCAKLGVSRRTATGSVRSQHECAAAFSLCALVTTNGVVMPSMTTTTRTYQRL
jgi:hypothetical protein